MDQIPATSTSPQSPRLREFKRRLRGEQSASQRNSKEKYSLEQLTGNLGGGSFSAGVYRVRTGVLKKESIVKVVKLKHLHYLRDEVEISRGFKHENVRKSDGKVETCDRFAYAIFIDAPGTDLYKLTIEKTAAFPMFVPDDPADLPGFAGFRILCKKILAGIEYLHSLNIVHNDLKLENVIVDADSVHTVNEKTSVKIIDFGLSYIYDPAKDKTASGSVGYSAPEKYIGPRPAQPCDIYSFGVMLYALSCHNALFDAEAPANKNTDQLDLITAALEALQKRFSEPRMRGVFTYDMVREPMLECLRPHPWDRPTAKSLFEFPFFMTSRPISPPVEPVESIKIV